MSGHIKMYDKCKITGTFIWAQKKAKIRFDFTTIRNFPSLYLSLRFFSVHHIHLKLISETTVDITQ